MKPSRATWLILGALALLVFVIVYGPIVVTVLGAFFETRGSQIDFTKPTIASFAALGSDESVIRAFCVTLIVCVVASTLAIVAGTTAALHYVSGHSVDRSVLQFLIFVPFVMPPMITGLALLIFFRDVGIARSLATVIIGHVIILLAVAYRTIVVRLSEISSSLTEAALDLGATHWQAFWLVTLPNLKSALIAAFILCFALSFDETLVTILVTGGESTFPVRLWAMMRLGFSPSVNAIVVIVLAISSIASFLAIRFVLGTQITQQPLGGEV
ncbi:ABC transporter permease [Mesorhizobium sp. B2-4-15]|nr:ABC transporter permease [Mesorhizobium sp. B2-4-15]